MIGVGTRQRRLGVDRRQAHLAHQPHDPLAIHRIPGPAQHRRHPPAPVKQMRRVFLVQTAHQLQIQGARLGYPVIPGAPGQPQPVTLRRQRQGGMVRFDPPPSYGGGFSPDFFQPLHLHLQPPQSGRTAKEKATPLPATVTAVALGSPAVLGSLRIRDFLPLPLGRFSFDTFSPNNRLTHKKPEIK
jgi:hypothetical protein